MPSTRWIGILAAAVIIVVGIPLVIGWNPFMQWFSALQLVQTSDAVKTKGTIKVGTDNFIGYYVLCEQQMRGRMRTEGYNLVCEDDRADYPKRMEKLAKRELQFAVATIDSYELNALKEAYPGLVVYVIDESKGADAIVSCRAGIKNIEGLKKPGLKFAFVPDSPSEYFIKGNATNFDIPQLRGADKSWRVEAKSSPDAAQKCAAGLADAAILWEPDVSKLLRKNPQLTKLMGTENTSRFIVDVLLVQREYADKNPGVVDTLLRNYVETLLYYRQNPETAAVHAADFVNANAPSADAKMTPEEAKIAMKGVTWMSLGENALLWFGYAEDGQQRQFGLIEAINSTTRTLIDNGDLQKNPFPNGGDPTAIIRGSFAMELYKSGMAGKDNVDLKQGDSLGREFTELSDDGWKQLREVGTLRVRPVIFPPGTDELSTSAKENVDRIVETVKSYPNFRILVEGHTAVWGDPNDNRELSQERADSITRYLMVTYGVKANRLHAVGFGGTKPLKKEPDESERSYQGRLARVVVKLMTEAY